jgi:hypothetical protein
LQPQKVQRFIDVSDEEDEDDDEEEEEEDDDEDEEDDDAERSFLHTKQKL